MCTAALGCERYLRICIWFVPFVQLKISYTGPANVNKCTFILETLLNQSFAGDKCYGRHVSQCKKVKKTTPQRKNVWCLTYFDLYFNDLIGKNSH